MIRKASISSSSLLVFLSLVSPLALSASACGGATSPELGGGADAAGGDSSSALDGGGGNGGDASGDHDADGGSTRDAAPDVETFDASATFPCGNLLVCHTHTEACQIGYGGVANTPPRYDCIPFPAQCLNARTCACVKLATSAQNCKEAAGDFTVEFFYP